MTRSPSHPPSPVSLGGVIQHYTWTHENTEARVAYETQGTGSPVVLLPAFSTVSTRSEMAEIAQMLSSDFQVTLLDWLGFGDSDRPPFDYQPSLYRQLLKDFIRDCFHQPIALIAAGHAAGYAMHFAHDHPASCTQLLLIAPTWKGPLRAMGAPRPVAQTVRNLVRSPLLGQALYALNTAPPFLKWMYQRHVYVNHDRLTPDFMRHKHQITQKPGARFAPAAFVTGALDPMDDREKWLQIGRSLSMPTLVILAAQAPPQSTAEMEALASLPSVQSQRLPGSLGLHEEQAREVGAIARRFLIS
jgi:pimeloyl-ACP methyl ester carboxylesterase